MITIEITTVGLAKIREAMTLGNSILITKFEIGDALGYTPTIGQASLSGNLLYSSESVGAASDSELTIVNIENNTNSRRAFELDLFLNDNIGRFDIGEFCLKLSDGTPLLFGVLSEAFDKKKSTTSKPGNTLNLKSIVNYSSHEGSYTIEEQVG